MRRDYFASNCWPEGGVHTPAATGHGWPEGYPGQRVARGGGQRVESLAALRSVQGGQRGKPYFFLRRKKILYINNKHNIAIQFYPNEKYLEAMLPGGLASWTPEDFACG